MGSEPPQAKLGNPADLSLDPHPRPEPVAFDPPHDRTDEELLGSDRMEDPVAYREDPDDDLGNDGLAEEAGPLLDTDFLVPAPSQALNADEEPGGMYGSTADEVIGSRGPDEQDLGGTEGDFARPLRNFGDDGGERFTVELQSVSNHLASTGIEDLLSTDLPPGGTDRVNEPLIDPGTGELTDYDDSPAD